MKKWIKKFRKKKKMNKNLTNLNKKVFLSRREMMKNLMRSKQIGQSLSLHMLLGLRQKSQVFKK